jgi:Right handed beta helix region
MPSHSRRDHAARAAAQVTATRTDGRRRAAVHAGLAMLLLVVAATGVAAAGLDSLTAKAATTTRPPRTQSSVQPADTSPADGVQAIRLGTAATTPPPAPMTYYVDSVNGDDARSGSSPLTAWRTLQRANTAPLEPGSRLLLRRGGNWSGSLAITRSGAKGTPIVVDAYGSGGLPRISGASSCVSLSGSFVAVRHLHVDGCRWAGFDIAGDYNRVRDSLVTHNAAGIHVRRDANGNAILHNLLRDNDRMSVLTKVPADDDSGAFAVLLQGDGTTVAFNTISGSDAFSYDYGRDGAAVEVYGGRDNHIHHNLAVDNDAFSELGDSRASGNRYADNVVRSSLASSIFLVTRGAESGFGPVLHTALYNNTVLLTGPSSQGFVCHGGCGPDILTMRDNLIQAVKKTGYADAPFDEDYGLYYGGPCQFQLGDHSRIGIPGFVDPAGPNLRLRGSSLAIDHGILDGYRSDFDLTPVPQDGNHDGVASPDVGAFEYHAA